MSEYGKNMLLVTSYWGEDKTFRMIPVLPDCPYVEAIYDPRTTLLVVISKNSKQKFQMVPRLNDDGAPMMVKHPKPNQDPEKKQRVTMEVYQEYYLTEKDEQEMFIKAFALNHDSYNYSEYLRELSTEVEKIMVPEAPPITDKDGKPIAADPKPVMEVHAEPEVKEEEAEEAAAE